MKNPLQRSLLVLLATVTLSACTKLQNGSTTTALTHDFFKSTLSAELASQLMASQPTAGDDCLAHVKAVTCLSDAEESGFDANCSKDKVTDDMLKRIPELLNELPPLHKKVLCNINRLQIQSKISSIAYATTIDDSNGNAIADMVGIRADALTGDNKADIFSWKEQLNFGLSKQKDPTYATSPQGPFVQYTIAQSQMPLVIDVVTHELSHLIDFLNGVNDPTCTQSADGVAHCQYRPDSFAALSWPADFTSGNDANSVWSEIRARYPWLSQLCYYDCEQTISPAHIGDVYSELNSTAFFTAYSASNNYEDFAEASAAFNLKNAGFRYQILNAKKETLFDSDSAWKSANFTAKVNWLNQFYSKPDLKYKY